MTLQIIPEEEKYHKEFISSPKKHILMITNHGIHQWKVLPGLPDTGGQNIFVNQFTNQLAKIGYKVTIVNRGGYRHPVGGEEELKGFRYREANRRILYLEDNTKEFVRKEDMSEHVLPLTHFLFNFLKTEGCRIDLIISHYWDAAKIGIELNDRLARRIKHVWVPHSLGEVKKRNMEEERWPELRIDERIEIEKTFVDKLDAVASTSEVIQDSLMNEYGFREILYLPPCINTERYYRRDVREDDPVWDYLSQRSTLEPGEIKKCKIITEVSRTDATKRKDVLIKAFIRVKEKYPDSFLVVSIEPEEKEIFHELNELIHQSKVEKHIAVVGSIWALLPVVYSITDIYCTPSVMEGFGMSAQEAAATGVPVVASDLVPFVSEFLLGDNPREIQSSGTRAPVKVGKGAVMVKADDVEGFALALETLLKDDALRESMGREALDITIPYFSWNSMCDRFLDDIGFTDKKRPVP